MLPALQRGIWLLRTHVGRGGTEGESVGSPLAQTSSQAVHMEGGGRLAHRVAALSETLPVE